MHFVVEFTTGCPRGTNSFANIRFGAIGTSPAAIGTAVGQQHLHGIPGFLDPPQTNSPEAHIQFKVGFLDEAGEIADAGTAAFLSNHPGEFNQFIAHVLTVLPRGA